MNTIQAILQIDSDFEATLEAVFALQPDLVLVFGALPFFESSRLTDALRRRAPDALLAGCSTAGEIVRPLSVIAMTSISRCSAGMSTSSMTTSPVALAERAKSSAHKQIVSVC